MVIREWSSSSGRTVFEYSATSSIGNVRRVNEDSYVAEPPVFLVADGMGGHSRGDAASAAVAVAFTERIVSPHAWTPAAVLEAIASSNVDVSALSVDSSSIAGTTLTGVVLVVTGATQSDINEVTAGAGEIVDSVEARYRWMVVNVGDSRVYHRGDGPLLQVTIDHSLVQELLEQGAITAEEAQVHPERNVITRALGVQEAIVPDVLLLPANGQQTFLICSDGVSNFVSVDEMDSALRDVHNDDDISETIVAMALAAGSRDNVTAIVLTATVTSQQDPSIGAELFEETQPRGQVVV